MATALDSTLSCALLYWLIQARHISPISPHISPYLPTSPHISLTLLYWRIQPGRCVFAFGGWAVGRAVHLSQDLLDLQVEIEMD